MKSQDIILHQKEGNVLQKRMYGHCLLHSRETYCIGLYVKISIYLIDSEAQYKAGVPCMETITPRCTEPMISLSLYFSSLSQAVLSKWRQKPKSNICKEKKEEKTIQIFSLQRETIYILAASLTVWPIPNHRPPTHPQRTSTLICPLCSQNRDYKPICIIRARPGLSRWEPCSARHCCNC